MQSIRPLIPMGEKLRLSRQCVKALLTRRANVLLYHRVVPSVSNNRLCLKVSVAHFEAHMRHLARYHHLVSIQELHRQLRTHRISRRRPVVITFDDGYQDNYRYAFPILRKYRLPFTIFLTTGFIGTERWFLCDELERFRIGVERKGISLEDWLINRRPDLATPVDSVGVLGAFERMTDSEREDLLDRLSRDLGVARCPAVDEDLPLTWEQVHEMANTGLVTFGAHTENHVMLGVHSSDYERREVERSRLEIAQRLGQRPTTFAYPYGKGPAVAGHAREIAQALGFDTAFTTHDRCITGSEDDHYMLGRRMVLNWSGRAFSRQMLRWTWLTDDIFNVK